MSAIREKSHGFPIWAAIALALAAACLLSLPRAAAVWGAGEFFDSDDAMRAVQVRDLLGGQDWFDMTARRVDPPNGLFMHWSRIVDAPLAALDQAFRLFLPPEGAERATRLVFPFACLAALLGLASWTARMLGGETSRIPAIWVTLLSAPMFVQFAPGRIDHHAPQIVLLMATFGFFALGLEKDRARAMALAAATMALSFGISLENLPFFVVLLAALPLLFVIEGANAQSRLAWFALGAFVSFPLCFIATIAPSRYALSACDAYSAVHLYAVLAGATGLLALSLFAPRIGNRSRRIFAAALAGAAVLAAVLFVAPQCLGDPLGGLDPLLRDLWLSHVVEAKSLTGFTGDRTTLIATALPVVLGLAAAFAAAWRTQGTARWRWAVAAAAIAVGFVAACWQIRVFSSVTPLAAPPLAFAAVAMTRRFAGVYSPFLQRLLIAVVCLAVSPIGLALALPPEGETSRKSERVCLGASAFGGLAALPPARIAAPIDLGAHLLAFTPHSAFGAPYHRDNHGNRIVVDSFLSDANRAEQILRDARADLVLWCVAGRTGAELLERAPSGLAAALARGHIPAWLVKIPLEGTPFHVFALRPAQ